MEEIKQGSPEWFAARAGKVTASRIADVMSKGRGGAEAAGRRNYRAQLVAERLSGVVEETYCNAAMQRGIDLEGAARECYEFKTGYSVDQVPFVDHPTIEASSASPDGLIGDDGMVEIKVPNIATHIDYLLGGVAPKKYLKQQQWQLACTGRMWNDFVSYCPELPDSLQLFVVRVARDDGDIANLEAEVESFLIEVEDLVGKLLNIKEEER